MKKVVLSIGAAAMIVLAAINVNIALKSEGISKSILANVVALADSENPVLLREQLAATVLYKACTPQFIEEYDIRTFCGLSCYIPHPQRNDLNSYYQQLGWCIDSGFSRLFQINFFNTNK
jgi:hypothetical protein